VDYGCFFYIKNRFGSDPQRGFELTSTEALVSLNKQQFENII